MVRPVILLIISWCLSAAVAAAGTIAPGLEKQLEELPAGQTLKVLVVLAEQADISRLDREIRAAKAGTGIRHRTVVEALKEVADSSQPALLEAIARDKARAPGSIVSAIPHWLVNAVVVTGDEAAIRALASRPEVARVEPDLVVERIAPVQRTAGKAKPQEIGITPGLRAIGAPEVWRDLGIDGSGAVIGIIDTGVDGAHPALASRWRGNFAPPEHCWLDAAGRGYLDFPVDHSYHGTHVMGTMTGLAVGDTIGVAPGARWIAANPLVSTSLNLDSAILAALEFMADPDGDPSTSDDVPDVVQNSWGISEAFRGYFDCDSRWWDAIDNCEAAGVVLVWSAGNEGPYPGLLRSPADRALTPTNCFSVGSTALDPPYPVSEFSSRGPSGCGGPFAIKPEVVAPGENVISAEPGGGYQVLSGTSMAGPHVAGVVALMRSANPDLDGTAIREILMATARDLGAEGEDNVSGHGIIDAFAAVAMVMTDVGTVEGTVRDAATGLPIEGATVRLADGFSRTVTDGEGEFQLTILSGAADLAVEMFGYFPGSIPVVIPAGGSVAGQADLEPMPSASIGGVVHGPDGQPVPQAQVRVVDTPVSVLADTAGQFELNLPAGPGFFYELRSRKLGLGAESKFLELQEDTLVVFDLPAQPVDDFETGDFSRHPWFLAGSRPFQIDGESVQSGSFSARSGPLDDDQFSTLKIEYFVLEEGDLSFWSRTSSEERYDFLYFHLDDELQVAWSGEVDWNETVVPVSEGLHTFSWSYVKDEVLTRGEDTAWVDSVVFPPGGLQPHARLEVDTATVPFFLRPDTTAVTTLLLGNSGDAILQFNLEASALNKVTGSSPQSGLPWLSVHPATGTVYPDAWTTVTLTVDAAGQPEGYLVGVLTLGTNDPDQPESQIPVVARIDMASGASDVPSMTLEFQGAVPNPFNPRTRLRFELGAPGEVELRIYDLHGALVRNLDPGFMAAGPHDIVWDGTGDDGRPAASGQYFARIRALGGTVTRSVVLVR